MTKAEISDAIVIAVGIAVPPEWWTCRTALPPNWTFTTSNSSGHGISSRSFCDRPSVLEILQSYRFEKRSGQRMEGSEWITR